MCKPRVILVIVALALGPAVARAQDAIGDGHVLDNSLEVGSGGINQPQQQPDFNAGNDIVTGNVVGGRQLRIDPGYRAPGELTVPSVDDALFRFRAASLSYPLLTGDYSNVAVSPEVRVYRPIGGDMRYVQLVPATRLESSGALPNPLINPSGMNVYIPDRRWGAATLGDPLPTPEPTVRASQPDGRLLEITATPLLGVRQRSSAGSYPSAPSAPDPNEPPTLNIPDGMATPDASIELPPANPRGAAVDPELRRLQTHRGTTPLLRDPLLATPSAAAGAPLHTPTIDAQRAGAPTLTLAQRVAQIEARLLTTQGSQSLEPGQDVYLDMLARIQRNQQIARGELPPADEPPAADPSAAPPEGPDESAPAPLAPPSEEQRRQAEAQRRQAMLRARGVAPLPPQGEDPQADSALADQAAIPTELARLAKLLDLPAPRVASLAGKRDDHINRLLTEAEKALAADRYLEAEQRYRVVIATSPGHPLARVGLVHAQLGAGMIRSATLSLRALFDQHPELITSRYQAQLLPESERLAWVRRELEDMVANTPRQEPAILLAYLGYQTDSPALTRYALDLAHARDPGDALVLLLRRLWLAPSTPSPARQGDPR